MEDETRPYPGVQTLDHTADVGLELEADDLSELLARAARGLAWLLLERELPGPYRERKLQVGAEGPAALLRELLRELLWWHESEGLTVRGLRDVAVSDSGDGWSVRATAELAADPEPPVREIKGVTLHGLLAEPHAGGWSGRVIFDV